MRTERQTIGDRLKSADGVGGGPFATGEVVQYTDGIVGEVMALVVSVHRDDVEPYYSIQYLPDDVDHLSLPKVSATEKNAVTRRSRRRQRRQRRSQVDDGVVA